MARKTINHHWREVVTANADRAALIEQREHDAACAAIARADEADRARIEARRAEKAPSRNAHRQSGDHRKSGGMVTIERRRKFRSG